MSRIKVSGLRKLCAVFFLLMAVAGLAWHTGWGTLSSFGIRSFAEICPLGALETMIAGQSVTLKLVCALIVFILFAVIFGRVFCGWMCPVPLIKETAGTEKKKKTIRIHCESQNTTAGKIEKALDATPYAVLVGALVSTGIFGFPVFCLICPVGLTFAVIIGLWQLFSFNDPSWTLLLFAGMLALEIFVLRHWCHKFCPLGALISLMSKANRFFRPRVDAKKCCTSKGLNCQVCAEVCPEGIDLLADPSTQDYSHCTKCMRCADACPEHAISFPLFAGKRAKTAGSEKTVASSASAAIAASDRPALHSVADVKAEAERCILCDECTAHCPVGKPIGDWMRLLREGKVRQASVMMTAPGQFPDICSRVCPQERLCEKGCALAAQGVPIAIGAIERIVSEVTLERGPLPRIVPKSMHGNVAVIGSGPAGLACAEKLAHDGVRVTVFDTASEIGGLLTYGIPAYKLNKDLIVRRREEMQAAGVTFRLNQAIVSQADWQAVLDMFDAVFVATGAPVSRPLDVANAKAAGVIDAVSYLRACAVKELAGADTKPDAFADLVGREVVVLGGGDTALDCIETALRQGAARVTGIYRKDREAMKAGLKEVATAISHGAHFLYGTAVTEITVNAEGAVTGVMTDKSGTVKADAVIVAYGLECKKSEALAAIGVVYDETGRIIDDGQYTGQTQCAKVFAGGDALAGPRLVATAIADGLRAAESIEKFIAGKSE